MPGVHPGPTDWSAYAQNYDHMCAHNPAYQENLDRLVALLPTWQLPENPRVLDVGAGTGNYIQAMARILKNARFTHFDGNAQMGTFARQKYDRDGIDVEMIHADIHDAELDTNGFDLITCIHALYAMPPQPAVLAKLHSWLKPGGTLFIIDLGRSHDVFDWVWYAFRELLRREGLVRSLCAVAGASESIKQNRLVRQGQDNGDYWLHTTSQFGSLLELAGFEVNRLEPCYRGYSDLAVCRKREPR